MMDDILYEYTIDELRIRALLYLMLDVSVFEIPTLEKHVGMKLLRRLKLKLERQSSSNSTVSVTSLCFMQMLFSSSGQ